MVAQKSQWWRGRLCRVRQLQSGDDRQISPPRRVHPAIAVRCSFLVYPVSQLAPLWVPPAVGSQTATSPTVPQTVVAVALQTAEVPQSDAAVVPQSGAAEVLPTVAVVVPQTGAVVVH